MLLNQNTFLFTIRIYEKIILSFFFAPGGIDVINIKILSMLE